MEQLEHRTVCERLRELELAGMRKKRWERSWHLAGGNEGGGVRLFLVAFSDGTKWTQVS